MRTRRQFLQFFALTVVCLTQTDCSCKPTEKQDIVVQMGTFSTAIDYAPFIVAKSKGWYDEAAKKHGATINYTTFQSLPPINESFASDRLDIAFEAVPPAVIGAAAGIDLTVGAVSCSLTQEIVSHTDSAINEFADLEGRKVAVLKGTSSHYGLLDNAAKAGIDPSSFELIDMAPPDAKNAFETNRVDVWAVWPPWAEQEIVAGRGKAIKLSDTYIHSVLVVRSDFSTAQPKLFEDLVAVHRRAKKWIVEHPADAQQLIANELGLELEVVKLAWPKHDFAATVDSPMLRDIDAKIAFLKEAEVIGSDSQISAAGLCATN